MSADGPVRGEVRSANRYHGRYTGRRLWRTADRGAWLDDGTNVFAYFNNDWYANAWHDALWLRERLAT